jgi:hypothetical protein
MTLDPKLVDKRVVTRNLDRGRLEAKQFDEWLEALPDLAGQVWQGEEDEPAGAPETPTPPE